jgi:haloacid dehalogenase superfamily, subfamily IA, variant 3 with third motif having DD or ED/haloacid dehalogenase superfamily, subfamily IA, variant 1 with third motif having Dx(3-4)D or Dx(3-4)E
MTGSIKAVLFDLDGTLLDSFPMHYDVYETMFSRFGIAMSRELFLSTYSPNWYRTYEAFGLAEEHWNAANDVWLTEAAKHTPQLFSGVTKVLVELSKSVTLGIVTSGSKGRVLTDLDRTGIATYFSSVVTGDDITEPKPSPEGLEIAMRQLSVTPAEAIYVGDAHADFEMARAARVRFFGVPSEFANLSPDHPEYDIHTINALPDMVKLLSS